MSKESQIIFNDSSIELIGVLESQRGGTVSASCNAYLKQVLKQICLTDSLKVESQEQNVVHFSLEFLMNLDDLKPILGTNTGSNCSPNYSKMRGDSTISESLKKSMFLSASRKQINSASIVKSPRFQFRKESKDQYTVFLDSNEQQPSPMHHAEN